MSTFCNLRALFLCKRTPRQHVCAGVEFQVGAGHVGREVRLGFRGQSMACSLEGSSRMTFWTVSDGQVRTDVIQEGVQSWEEQRVELGYATKMQCYAFRDFLLLLPTSSGSELLKTCIAMPTHNHSLMRMWQGVIFEHRNKTWLASSGP